MMFVFDENAGKSSFSIKGDGFKYLIKVRRHSEGDEIDFRSPNDTKTLYRYKIVSLGNRSLDVELVSSKVLEIKANKNLHIGWCMIDTKSIEKVLPSLSEIGVSKISFIYCDRSQRNFKVDFKRFERILYSSMQQSGRSSFIEFDSFKNIKEFVGRFPHAKVFDFCDKTLDDYSEIDTVLIGCEGGFSKDEREFLEGSDVFSLATPMVLRSESAVVAVASKVLL
jgi:16S rRNA (uracil1498-N3)-methyltransferase